MDSDVSTDQGNFPTHGIRDVRLTVDRKQHDWSELAEAPEINTLLGDQKSYRQHKHVVTISSPCIYQRLASII